MKSDHQAPLASTFRPLSNFGHAHTEYRFLPFRFLRWSNREVLLVNDAGEHIFLNNAVFDAFVSRRLSNKDDVYADLKASHFLIDSAPDGAIERLATQYRTQKSFLEGFTKLHMFVVTLRCDHSCRYCQVSRVSMDRSRYDMSEEVARRAVDLMFQVPSRHLKVEFQGGESLLNFDRIRFLVNLISERADDESRSIEYVIATNLTPLSTEILDFCKRHSILLSISLDGPEWLHNSNRPRPGKDSHQVTIRHLQWAREILGHDRISAIMTTTAHSLNYPREIVDEYVQQGFSGIFLRPISPYGHAVRTREANRYEMAQFLSFYEQALQHIIELNRSGTDLLEVYAQILLSKILTPFPNGYVDLQSPSGAGIGAVAYNYDGFVYASDESRMLAEMGDSSFRLGHVLKNSFQEIFGSEAVRALVAGSVLETLPGCAECAFLPFCGADPIFNYRTQGDIVGHRPTSAFCTKNMAIFRHLFDLLRSDDPFVRHLLTSWGTGVGLGSVAAECNS